MTLLIAAAFALLMRAVLEVTIVVDLAHYCSGYADQPHTYCTLVQSYSVKDAYMYVGRWASLPILVLTQLRCRQSPAMLSGLEIFVQYII